MKPEKYRTLSKPAPCFLEIKDGPYEAADDPRPDHPEPADPAQTCAKAGGLPCWPDADGNPAKEGDTCEIGAGETGTCKEWLDQKGAIKACEHVQV